MPPTRRYRAQTLPTTPREPIRVTLAFPTPSLLGPPPPDPSDDPRKPDPRNRRPPDIEPFAPSPAGEVEEDRNLCFFFLKGL
ncbi:hypothetical protein TIFTF001_000438 [Ficus carica]|uniref:Uncharacterized protein n=1 Tax=Ficus carica TaxID=3494 RepID=A0AA88CP64_FICCA|nr:hypothetical protein TIFTF001_000438 [Ficus carica]